MLKIKTSHKQKQNIISFNAMQTHCRRGNSSMYAEWSLLLFNGIKSKEKLQLRLEKVFAYV